MAIGFLKFLSAIWPFLKTLIFGKKDSRNKNQPSFFFMVLLIFLMFIVFMFSFKANNDLHRKYFDATKTIESLQKENNALQTSLTGANHSLQQCSDKQPVDPKLASCKSLTPVEPTYTQKELWNKVIHLANSDIHLYSNMPDYPPIPKEITEDNDVVEYLTGYITLLREYIKTKDKEISSKLEHCN